jgi:hypothetical protein
MLSTSFDSFEKQLEVIVLQGLQVLGRLLIEISDKKKGTHFPLSDFVNLKMGKSVLFLFSPSRRANVKRVSGGHCERHFSAHKNLSILKGKKRGYSVFGIQW